jgi:hypothetical protein
MIQSTPIVNIIMIILGIFDIIMTCITVQKYKRDKVMYNQHLLSTHKAILYLREDMNAIRNIYKHSVINEEDNDDFYVSNSSLNSVKKNLHGYFLDCLKKNWVRNNGRLVRVQ